MNPITIYSHSHNSITINTNNIVSAVVIPILCYDKNLKRYNYIGMRSIY